MKITVGKLKSLIREAIAGSQMRLSADEHPGSFNEYRLWIASIASQAGAHDDMIEAIKDVSDRGSQLAKELHGAWRNAEAYFETGDSHDVIDGLEQLANVHDVLLDIGCDTHVAQRVDNIVSNMVSF